MITRRTLLATSLGAALPGLPLNAMTQPLTTPSPDDPHLWLEDVTGESALAWVRERNAETRRVLGCHIVAPGAGEMIQLAAIAIVMGATKEDFDRTCAVHPTMAEELVTMRKPVRTA